jgi:hypothetical protein
LLAFLQEYEISPTRFFYVLADYSGNYKTDAGKPHEVTVENLVTTLLRRNERARELNLLDAKRLLARVSQAQLLQSPNLLQQAVYMIQREQVYRAIESDLRAGHPLIYGIEMSSTSMDVQALGRDPRVADIRGLTPYAGPTNNSSDKLRQRDRLIREQENLLVTFNPEAIYSQLLALGKKAVDQRD